MASLSNCHLGLWLGWQILLNLVKCAYMRMCVWTHVCMYIRAHMHVCTYVHVRIYAFTYVRMYAWSTKVVVTLKKRYIFCPNRYVTGSPKPTQQRRWKRHVPVDEGQPTASHAVTSVIELVRATRVLLFNVGNEFCNAI